MTRAAGSWFGQPKGLTILFLTEMWEKFSFFGMRALQVYYMTKQLHFSQASASLVYGTYAAGVYLTPIFGGIISDRWLGRRRAVVIGGLLMALGHFMMAFEALFFPAMVAIALGNGLFLPNLPSQVGALYDRQDPRRAGAYNVYYVGINLGAFLAPLICGTVGEVYGWHYGFAVAGVGMCLGLAIYLLGSRHLPRDEVAADETPAHEPEGDSRWNLLVLLAVGAAVVLFRSAYEQTGNTLAVWSDTSLDRAFFGLTIPVTWVQSLNPMFVFLLSPLVVAAWNRRAPGAHVPAALRRMAIGALGVAVSYLLLAAVIRLDAQHGRPTHWAWLVAFFLLFTLAELYILPVGLGLFARLAPRRFGATTIAAWFLAAFAGNLLSGVVGAWWERVTPDTFFIATAGIAFVSCAMLWGIDVMNRRHEQDGDACAAALPAGSPAPQVQRVAGSEKAL
jgi:POT family proton-dependent oligopeptide transporter